MSVYTAVLNQFTIYVGSVFLIVGVSGNLINAGVFFKNNLRNPSTFLLFLASCSNIVYISIGLLSRILSASSNIDVASNSLGWCKMRFYLLQLFALTSNSFICYATIDQFFLTSQIERFRRLSQISTTRRVICILILFWMLYSIPLFIFSGLVSLDDGRMVCVFINKLGFSLFASYFNLPIVWGLAPITVLIVFGSLTYRNVSLLKNVRNRGRAQRHLTSMILLYIIFIIIGTLPYTVFYGYRAITSNIVKSVDRRSLELFLSNIVAVILYSSNSCSFLVYYLASPTYRRQVKRFFHIPTRTRHLESVGSVTSEREKFEIS